MGPEGDMITFTGELQPEVGSVGVADAVGDDLLNAAQHGLSPQGVIHIQVRREGQVDRRPGDGGTEPFHSLAQVDDLITAQSADNFPHVTKQFPIDLLGAPDMLLGFPLGQVPGDFQIQVHGGEVMAEEIVQFP